MKTRQERLKSALREAELTQLDLAQRVGVSAPTISELFAGKSKSSKHLPKIAQVLGVSAIWLDTGAGDRYDSDVELTDAERQILAYWRKFTPESRKIVLAQMKAFLDHAK